MLSPVRMSDRQLESQDAASNPQNSKSQGTHEMRNIDDTSYWVEEDDVKGGRLPFSTTTPVKVIPTAVSVDSSLLELGGLKEAPRTMIYSRSQDLYGTAIAGKHRSAS